MEVDEGASSIGSVSSNEDMSEVDKGCSSANTKRLIADQGSGRCMSTQAMQSLYDLRQNNLLCDAVLRLEDGGVFPIHRAILSACSTYFRCYDRSAPICEVTSCRASCKLADECLRILSCLVSFVNVKFYVWAIEALLSRLLSNCMSSVMGL